MSRGSTRKPTSTAKPTKAAAIANEQSAEERAKQGAANRERLVAARARLEAMQRKDAERKFTHRDQRAPISREEHERWINETPEEAIAQGEREALAAYDSFVAEAEHVRRQYPAGRKQLALLRRLSSENEAKAIRDLRSSVDVLEHGKKAAKAGMAETRKGKRGPDSWDEFRDRMLRPMIEERLRKGQSGPAIARDVSKWMRAEVKRLTDKGEFDSSDLAHLSRENGCSPNMVYGIKEKMDFRGKR